MHKFPPERVKVFPHFQTCFSYITS